MSAPAHRRLIPLAAWLLVLACLLAAPSRAEAKLTPPAKLASWGFDAPSAGRPDAQPPADQDGIRVAEPCAYELASGRFSFLSEDPIGFAGGSNFYAYANGDPISLVDPFGLGAQDSGGGSILSRIGGVATQTMRLGVPGVAAWDNAQASFAAGDYGNAVGWTVGMLAEQVLAVGTLGTSTLAQTTTRAATTTATQVGGTGYRSFSAFKRAEGVAGQGQALHHIVEQTPGNLERFGAQAIHHTENIVALPHGPGTIHNQISAFYSSKQAFTGGQTVRQWLSTKSFEEQAEFGRSIMQQFGGTP